MYPEARLQSTLVTKDSYDKGMQSCVECARNTTPPPNKRCPSAVKK